jgi:hypothetical protein
MKPIRSILLITLFAAATSVLAQAPQRFNYQAVARDASGNAISEKTLGVRISIVEGSAGGTTLYTETFSPTTSKQGLFSIQVGGGTPATGTFASIVWNSGAKFLKVEIDPAGGSAFTLLGTSQLLSVPFAFAADKLSSPMSIKDLSDVSDDVPSVNQVLRWNGSEWKPDNAGSGTLVTSTALSGDGSAATPLTIAQQSATNGQVLQWNGSEWKPATVSGGVGDNWGTQSVVVNSSLTGNGTPGAPLGVTTTGASNGSVLKFDGLKWVAGVDAGDNWGTAKVNTSTQFAGDGTPVSPLKLASNGAAAGQFLKFDGTNWIPGDGGSGSLTLPASGTAADAGPAMQIMNTNGGGIIGQTQGTGANITGLTGIILNTSGGNGSAGVYGRNLTTGTNGFGVIGVHEGSGVGVSGIAKTGNGIAVDGLAQGPSGIGVHGVGSTGVAGTTQIANGKGVYGNSTLTTGYAAWFDGQTMLKNNSTTTTPNLYIWEDDMNDKTRVRFNNGIANEYWDILARTTSSAGVDLDKFAISHFSNGDILTVSGDKRVGINVSNPETELEINGSLKLSGGIKLNGTFGTTGQVLLNTGGSIAWGSGTNALYANTILGDQTADLNNVNTPVTSLIELPGLDDLTSFTTTGNTTVIFTFSHSQLVSTSTGDVDLQIEIGFQQGASIINRAIVKDVILNGKTKSISYTHHCHFSGAGTYKPYIYIGTGNSGKFNAVGTGSSTGQVSIQVIRQ